MNGVSCKDYALEVRPYASEMETSGTASRPMITFRLVVPLDMTEIKGSEGYTDRESWLEFTLLRVPKEDVCSLPRCGSEAIIALL